MTRRGFLQSLGLGLAGLSFLPSFNWPKFEWPKRKPKPDGWTLCYWEHVNGEWQFVHKTGRGTFPGVGPVNHKVASISQWSRELKPAEIEFLKSTTEEATKDIAFTKDLSYGLVSHWTL